MLLKSLIDTELLNKGKTFKWLVQELKMSHDGLRRGLENESISLKNFKKLLIVLNIPVQNMLAGDTTIQKIKGNYNNQAFQSLLLHEPDDAYKTEIENLREQVRLLKSQMADKDRIIELLEKNKT